MRALLQRVSEACVEAEGQLVGAIGPGLLIFAALLQSDDAESAQAMAERIVNFRLFADERQRMNRSALDVGAELLAVPQFTLGAVTDRGARPGFQECAPPERAEPLFEDFVRALQTSGLRVQSGRFGALMQVRLTNDGPVSFVIEGA